MYFYVFYINQGVDIINVNRVEFNNDKLLQRFLTTKEYNDYQIINNLKLKKEFLAGRWAAKEAIIQTSHRWFHINRCRSFYVYRTCFEGGRDWWMIGGLGSFTAGKKVPGRSWGIWNQFRIFLRLGPFQPASASAHWRQRWDDLCRDFAIIDQLHSSFWNWKTFNFQHKT